MKRTMMKTTRLMSAVVMLGAFSFTVSVAAPASAATVTTGVNIRACVDLNNAVCSNPVGTTSGSGVSSMRCYRDGSWATGAYSSNRWFLVNLSDGREGYVHSSFVQNQASVPHCSTLAYVRAADKAISYAGQVYANGDIASKYTDWAPGPYAEWSGDCAKLAHSSYVYGAGVGFETGNAIDMFYKYRNKGMIYGGLPRYGSPVFYNIAAPYGHVAVYIGGTSIITTQGMDNARLPVSVKGIYDYANYLGWARVG